MGFVFKLLSVWCVLFSITSSTLAGLEEKIRFGVKGGLNTSRILVSMSDYNPDNYLENFTKYRFNAGFNKSVFVEIYLSESLSFQPEIAFSIKGMRNESFMSPLLPRSRGYGDLELDVKSNITSYYIELPMHLKAVFDIGTPGKIIAGIGPYIAYGIGGKMQSQFNISSYSGTWEGSKNIFNEENINFYKSKGLNIETMSILAAIYRSEPYSYRSFKRLDGGISGFFGYEFPLNLFITGNCSMGLINLLNSAESNDVEGGGRVSNLTFSISLGYKFNKKIKDLS